MGFPDQIVRTVELAHPPSKVWAALTTAEGLAAWFGNAATIDLRVGGVGRLTWDESHATDLRVERLDEPTSEGHGVFGFTWRLVELPEDDQRRTYVEFTLEPVGGGTRLTVVESGFAQLPDQVRQSVFDSHTAGWPHELGELKGYLDGP